MVRESFREDPEDHFDTEMRLKAIESGGASHNSKIADEQKGRLGIPAYDESLVADWIRNRVEPPKDMASGRGISNVEVVKQPEGDYEKDLEKLRSLTPKELEGLLTTVEIESRKGRRSFSKGNLLNGYAIDSQTLESLQSKNHSAVNFDLAFNIAEKLVGSGASGDTVDVLFITLLRRIVKGQVYPEVPGFKTPIIKFDPFRLEKMNGLVPEEYIAKITNHIKRERKLLPVTADLRVL
ncbi:MAG: hypothetical protein AAB809_02180 [Patescibacteria group bacterium]